MTITISDNTKSIMDDLDSGNAFDTTMLSQLGSLNGEWSQLSNDQNDLFGSFSPIDGMFDGLENSNPLSAADVAMLTNLSTDQQAALVGMPTGTLSNLLNHASSQFSSLADNLSLYSTHQSVLNALGSSSGCNALTDQFGSLMSFGQGIATSVAETKTAIDSFKGMKTQLQGEINNFDQNAVAVLTGKVNNSILSQVVVGSGLQDQVDNILTQAGITDVQDIKSQIEQSLTPNLTDFFTKKTAVNTAVSGVHAASQGILAQVSKELTVANEATETLKTLGSANSLSNLFKTNECAQTLLGFVASSSFLGKLGL